MSASGFFSGKKTLSPLLQKKKSLTKIHLEKKKHISLRDCEKQTVCAGINCIFFGQKTSKNIILSDSTQSLLHYTEPIHADSDSGYKKIQFPREKVLHFLRITTLHTSSACWISRCTLDSRQNFIWILLATTIYIGCNHVLFQKMKRINIVQ